MTDILALNQVIGEAYSLSQVANDEASAVKRLRDAMGDPETRKLAESRCAELAGVVRARTVGARCACHISKVTHDLLSQALQG